MGETETERLDYITQGKSVWLFTVPDLPLHSEIVSFQHELLERGYTACPLFIDREDLNGRVYVPTGVSCEQVVVSCGE